MKTKRAVLSLLVLFYLSLLQGCGEEVLNFNFSQFKVENLSSQTYIGLVDNPAPMQGSSTPFPSEIVINYNDRPNSIKITINGYPVGDRAVISNSDIRMSYESIKEFLRQGDNTFHVAPNNFGPLVRFVFADEGPKIDIAKVEDLGNSLNIKVDSLGVANVTEVSVQPMSYDWKGSYDDVDGNTDFQTASYTELGSPIALIEQNGSWNTVNSVDKTNMYKITAADEYGYITEDYYLKAGEKISNLFKLRLSKNMMDQVTKILKPQVQGMHSYSQRGYDYLGGTPPAEAEKSEILDSMNKWWTSGAVFYGDVGSSTANENNCGYVDSPEPNMSQTVCTNYEVDKDNNQYCTAMSWDHKGYNAKAGKCSRIIMKRMKLNTVDKFVFTLNPNTRSQLDLDMKLSGGMNVDMGIRDISCGSRAAGKFIKKSDYKPILGSCLHCKKTDYYRENVNYCYDDGAVSYLGANLGNMEITANGVSPKGGIVVDIKNGNLTLGFNNVKLNLSGTAIGGSMSGFFSWAIGLIEGLLDGMFVDIVKGVLQSNLAEFILGFDLYTDYDAENKPSLAMQAQAFNVWTNAGDTGINASNVEWFMEYAGYLKPYEDNLSMIDDNDPDAVHTILGSRFIPQDTKLPEANADTDMDIAVNINLINQVLASMYLSGVTHVTIGQLKSGNVTEFGFNQKQNLESVQIGDKLVELIPRTPGYIELDSTDSTANGTIFYRNAKMLIQTYNQDGWHVDFNVSVDMRFGVHMTANDDKFQMTLLGTPSLLLNRINYCDKKAANDECRTEGGKTVFENKVGKMTLAEEGLKTVVQVFIDMAMNLMVPVLSEQFAELDYPRIAIPFTKSGDKYDALKLKTKKISTNNNEHLTFALKTEAQDNSCVLSQESEDKLIENDNKVLVFCEEE